jgi:hypothetical protein
MLRGNKLPCDGKIDIVAYTLALTATAKAVKHINLCQANSPPRCYYSASPSSLACNCLL